MSARTAHPSATRTTVPSTLRLAQGLYNKHPDAWVRNDGPEVSKKHDELFSQLYILTGHSTYTNEWNVIDHEYYEDGRFRCVCSKCNLYDIYIIEHIHTKHKVLIGSECVKQFGDDRLNTDVKAYKRGNKCSEGNIIKDLRTATGRKRFCDIDGCICSYPKCTDCNSFEDQCVCIRCDNCAKITRNCGCVTCKMCEQKMKARSIDFCTGCENKLRWCKICKIKKHAVKWSQCFTCSPAEQARRAQQKRFLEQQLADQERRAEEARVLEQQLADQERRVEQDLADQERRVEQDLADQERRERREAQNAERTKKNAVERAEAREKLREADKKHLEELNSARLAKLRLSPSN